MRSLIRQSLLNLCNLHLTALKLWFFALLLFSASSSSSAFAQDYYAPPPGGSYQQEYAPSPGNDEVEDYSMFYDSLAPFGDWFFVEEYGYVWMPRVNHATWRPYVDGGNWVWSDYGWMWVSSYEWGWAPFHYGRWLRLDGLYWVWIPDAVWGPAWVAWRYTDADVGWAPLPPGAYWYPNYGLDIMVPIDWGYWVFVSGAYIFSPTINVYVYPTYRTQRIYYASRPSTVYQASSGVPVCVGVDIRRVGVWVGAPVRQVSITLSSSYVVYRAGYSTSISIYRPPVRMVSARYVPTPPAPRMAAPSSLYRMSAPPAPRGSVASSQHYKARAVAYKSSSNNGNQGQKAPYGGQQYGGKNYKSDGYEGSSENRQAPQPYKSEGRSSGGRQYERPEEGSRSAPPPAVQQQQLMRESRQQAVESQREYQRSTRDGSSQETVDQRRQQAEQSRSNLQNNRNEVQRERTERRQSNSEQRPSGHR